MRLVEFELHNERLAVEMYEALQLQHDKNNKLLVATSTETDKRKAGNDTYRNKGTLKSAGFKWTGGAWTIPDTELETATSAITQANKTAYLINKLEDVIAFIGDATADPKKKKLEDLIKGYVGELSAATDEAAASDEIERYLNFYSDFHQYSFNNKILVYIQFPTATKVASKTTWKKRGREVSRGAKAISILVPRFPPGRNPLFNKQAEIENQQPIGWGVGSVFDVSETSATSAKGEIPDQPKWWGDNTPDETADELYGLIRNAASDEGINVTNDVARGGEKGFSAGGHINITSDVEGAGRVSTMAHEYAHELMHWEDSSKFFVGKDTGKDIKELQAESVSYVVLRHYGIPAKHHSKYLALWQASGEKIQQHIGTISKVADHIIRAIDKQKSKRSKES